MKKEIFGVLFDDMTMEEAVAAGAALARAEDGFRYIVTPNPEIVNVARKEERYRRILNEAALVLPDGIGILHAAKILGTPMQERVPGIDFATGLLALLAQTGQRLYLLGAKPGVAEEAADKLLETYPDLCICGTADGYFNDSAAAAEEIRLAAADVVFVCLGAPKQERWMARYGPKTGAKLMVGLGGVLDVFAGQVRRAPERWQKMGLEWFYRLLHQPSRFGRMAKLPLFLFAAMGVRLRGGREKPKRLDTSEQGRTEQTTDASRQLPKSGMLIVLEGTDGSGKSTQFVRLCERLEQGGTPLKRLVFPQYQEDSSALIRMYLQGEFGTAPSDVNPYAASTFYAVDRYASWKKVWGEFYETGGLILADRYTTSNAVHQAAKLPPEERSAFFQWLFPFEYDLLGLPAPDLILYLDMPTEQAVGMLRKREADTHTTGDIHETDVHYLQECRAAALQAVEECGWQKISCVDTQGALRSVEEIHEEIWKLVQEQWNDA